MQKGTNPRVDSYSGFADNNYSEITQLSKILYQNHIDTVIVTGLATDYCVKETCLDSIKFGFKTILAIDATKPVDPSQLESTLSQLSSKGVLILPYSEIEMRVSTNQNDSSNFLEHVQLKTCTTTF